MATTEFIAAIELGSSKITGVAGRKNSDGSMQILAYAQEDSSTFIRKGVIFNLDKTAQSLTSIINRLEGELKNSIAKVYVGIGGQSLRTVRNVVSRDLEEEAIISEELVSAIGDENVAIPEIHIKKNTGRHSHFFRNHHTGVFHSEPCTRFSVGCASGRPGNHSRRAGA